MREPVIEDTWVEPTVALKLGPFACFCVCDPSNPGASTGKTYVEEPRSRKAASDYIEKPPSRVPSLAASSLGGPEQNSFIAAQAPDSTRSTSSRAPAPGHLEPVVRHFEAAVVVGGEGGEAAELLRVSFVSGMEAYVSVLNRLSGGMGDYLDANVKKLKASKADPSVKHYRAWILTELPVHGPKYQGYVDNSAFMGNLWIAWTLEFFVEFFAELSQGKETKGSGGAVELAYNRSLYNHQNYFQRQSFYMAMKGLPSRSEMLNLLKDTAQIEDAIREVTAFVMVGRIIVKFLLDTNEVVSKEIEEEKKKVRRGAWG